MLDTVPMALSLPSRYYVDPEYYRDELEWFFGSMWFYAGRAEEIPARGDYVLREVAGESLIVVRGDRGAINTFYNVCRHRGTRLCEEAAGSTGSTLRCPYHAWVYDLDGRLVGAPHMERVEGFRPEDYPLARLGVDLWDGLIFVNLRERPGCSLATQLGGMDEKFRAWGMGELRAARRVVYDVAANWKLIIHNYSECLHCPGVHPALQKLSSYLSSRNEPADDGYLGGRMGLREGVATLTFDGRTRRACLPGLDPSECRNVYYYAVLPNLLLSLHPDYVMTHALWPRGVGRTEIVCEWLFHAEAVAAADFDPEDAVAFWDLTNRQDWHVCEQMQLGLGSRAYRPGPYSHREDLLPAFDRIILERERAANGSGGPRPPAPGTDSHPIACIGLSSDASR